MLMDSPLINVLTRASRKDSIQPSIESVASQTYENYHHIITYETKEMGEYLESIVNLEKTTLVKVPKYKHFPELSFSYNHHNDYTKFLEPNWEFWERKVHINGEGYDKDYKLEVESPRYEKEGLGWNIGYNHTWRTKCDHFPYNQYLKIAERYLKKGWVTYLDDDDKFLTEGTLKEMASSLEVIGEDTLVINKIQMSWGIKPEDENWFAMQVGHPLVQGAIGSCNFIFHSKYADYTVWDEWRGADYRTAKCLEEIIPDKVFLDKVFVGVNLAK